MSLLPPMVANGSGAADWFREFTEDPFDKMGWGTWLDVWGCPIMRNTSVGKSWADEFILPGAASAAPLKRRAALSGVGRTNDMVASECESACHWNGPLYNGTALDVEMTIEAARFGEWATAVKRIVAMDLFQGGKPDLCMGPGYIW